MSNKQNLTFLYRNYELVNINENDHQIIYKCITFYIKRFESIWQQRLFGQNYGYIRLKNTLNKLFHSKYINVEMHTHCQKTEKYQDMYFLVFIIQPYCQLDPICALPGIFFLLKNTPADDSDKFSVIIPNTIQHHGQR